MGKEDKMLDRKEMSYNCILNIKSTKYKFYQIKDLEPNIKIFKHASTQKQNN